MSATEYRALMFGMFGVFTGHFITKLCNQQVQVIEHHENIYVSKIGQGEA
jgi:hypothetical protein